LDTVEVNALCPHCYTYIQPDIEHLCAGKIAQAIVTAQELQSLQSPNVPDQAPKITSDGGSTAYYDFPPGAKTLMDLIEYKNMPFGLGNIFKAVYRFGEKDVASKLYDINKIIWFAERIKAQLEKA